MENITIKPEIGYLRKQRLIFTLIAFIVTVSGALFGVLISIEEGAQVGMNVFGGFLIAAVVFWVPSMILAGFYYRSLSYEIQDDEVIVRVGIMTKSVKHVPYRTVTNVTVTRGILDRYVFNLGNLNIQTAGMSGTTGAEESLVGLSDVQSIYDSVVNQLRLFRGGMSPTAADEDPVVAGSSAEVLAAILDELRAIRRNTEK